MKTIKKSFAILKNSFLNSFSDPGKFYTFFLWHITTALTLLVFWAAVFKIESNFKGYTFKEIILYYVGGKLLSRLLTTGKAATSIQIQIADGTFSQKLIQPLSWNIRNFVTTVGNMLNNSISGIGILIIITLIFNKNFISLYSVPLLFIVAILSTVLNYYLYSIIGILAFYTTNTAGIRTVYGKISDLAAGKIFPLDMLPLEVLGLLKFLPFQYTYFIVMQFYLNRISVRQLIEQIPNQLLWILVAVLIQKFLFSKGIKHYDAIGI